LAAEDARQHIRLAVVGVLVDKDAGGAYGLSRPRITFPSPDPDKAQIVKGDVAVMAVPDMPKQDRFAGAVIGSLRKGARTRDGTAAIVEPVSGDASPWNPGHRRAFVDRTDLASSAFARSPPKVNPW
jgi:hypothetical protein